MCAAGRHRLPHPVRRDSLHPPIHLGGRGGTPALCQGTGAFPLLCLHRNGGAPGLRRTAGGSSHPALPGGAGLGQRPGQLLRQHPSAPLQSVQQPATRLLLQKGSGCSLRLCPQRQLRAAPGQHGPAAPFHGVGGTQPQSAGDSGPQSCHRGTAPAHGSHLSGSGGSPGCLRQKWLSPGGRRPGGGQGSNLWEPFALCFLRCPAHRQRCPMSVRSPTKEGRPHSRSHPPARRTVCSGSMAPTA